MAVAVTVAVAVAVAATDTHPLTFCDHPKEITLIAEIHNHKNVIPLLEHLVQRHDIGVPARQLVQGNLSPLEVPLAAVEAGTKEAFHSKVDGFRSVKIDGEVNDTVSTEPEDGEELEAAVVDGVADEVTAGGSESVGWHLAVWCAVLCVAECVGLSVEREGWLVGRDRSELSAWSSSCEY